MPEYGDKIDLDYIGLLQSDSYQLAPFYPVAFASLLDRC